MTNSLRLVLPTILGVLFALGDNVTMNAGHLELRDPSLYINILILILLFTGFFHLVDIALSHLNGNRAPVSNQNPLSTKTSVTLNNVSRFATTPLVIFERLLNAKLKGSVLLGWLIFCCWLPYLLVLFPGVYWADGSSQLIQYYGGAPLTDHHPYLDTILFGGFSDLGRTIFDSEIIGLYILIIIQAVLAATLFAALIKQTYLFGVSSKLCFGLVLFFAFFPFFPVMFSSLAKDTVSALFFLAFCYQLSEAIYTQGRSLDSPTRLALITMTAILLSLTKKTMAYVALPCLILLAVTSQKSARRLALTSSLATALVVFVLYPALFLPAMGVAPGGKQEALAVPIQQIAHDVTFNSDEINPTDREIIDRFLSCDYEEIPALYNFEIVDGIKGRSLEDDELLPQFIQLWLRKTIEHPLGHLDAWLGLAHGWIDFRNADGSPNNMIVLTESLWYEDAVLDYVDWPQSDSLNLVVRDVYNFIQSIPIINFLFLRSTWATVFPFALVFVAIGKGYSTKRSLVFLSPIMLSTLSLALVPVSGMGGEPTRYVFQCVCMIPFAFAQLPLLGRASAHGCIVGFENE